MIALPQCTNHFTLSRLFPLLLVAVFHQDAKSYKSLYHSLYHRCKQSKNPVTESVRKGGGGAMLDARMLQCSDDLLHSPHLSDALEDSRCSCRRGNVTSLKQGIYFQVI